MSEEKKKTTKKNPEKAKAAESETSPKAAEERNLQWPEWLERPQPKVEAELEEPEQDVEEPAEPGKKKRKHKKKNYLLRLGIFVAILVAAGLLMHISYFDVIGVAVAGNDELSSEEVTELSGIEVGKSIFDVHPFFVERKLKENLYIEDVEVNRKLPNTIEIVVVEKQPSAQFKNNKKYIVVDSDGKVMNISEKRKDVTLVRGITVVKARTGKVIQVEETDRYEKVMKLIAVTAENDLYFKRIRLEDGWVKACVYKKIYVKGKYANVINSIQSKELVAVVYDLYQKDITKGTINVGSNNYCSFTKKI